MNESPYQTVKNPSPSFKAKKMKQAIKLLNDIVKVRIAPSSIHGVGVFAMRDLKKGEQMELDAIPHMFDVPYSKLGELNKEAREIILSHWPNIITGSHFLYPVTKMTAFLNHSDTPNYDAKTDKMLKNVKKGEELTEDYRLIALYDKVFPFLDEGKKV
jgi:hypothetical protein